MSDGSDFLLIVMFAVIFTTGIFAGTGIAFDNYKCTDERIENHEIVCYRWEKKP